MARILIADDDFPNIMVLKAQIEATKSKRAYTGSLEFVEANCGDEAERILEKGGIDFAVLDEEMIPGKKGSEIARNCTVPCAVYTANMRVYDGLKEAGIPAFRKPLDRWDLCNYILDIVE